MCFNFGCAISYARKSYWIIQIKCKRGVKSSTTCTKMSKFCRPQFFPNDLGGKRIHVDHRKYVNSENERFCYDFWFFVVWSLCVQLIVLKKFSVINGIFSKTHHQVARWHCNTPQNSLFYIQNKKDRIVVILTVVVFFFRIRPAFFRYVPCN